MCTHPYTPLSWNSPLARVYQLERRLATTQRLLLLWSRPCGRTKVGFVAVPLAPRQHRRPLAPPTANCLPAMNVLLAASFRIVTFDVFTFSRFRA